MDPTREFLLGGLIDRFGSLARLVACGGSSLRVGITDIAVSCADERQRAPPRAGAETMEI